MRNILTLALMCMALNAVADDYTFRLKNTLGFARQNETVEVEISTDVDLSRKQLTDEHGHALPYELCGSHGIRFMASVPHGTSVAYRLSDGSNHQPTKLTYAAIKAPTSRADIAWENDRSAARMYSSVLLGNEPNTGNGVDLWFKKKSTPVIDNMYSLSNYHAENEYGVDAYSVNGKRLGNGGVSHVVDGKLVVHTPHDKCAIEENGALRSTFRLTYNNIKVDGIAYTKTLIVSTTAGSLLNKATVCYTPVQDGTGKPMRLAVALYQHTDMQNVNHQGVSYTATPGLIGWAENKSEGSVTTAGARFYQGAYIPQDPAALQPLNITTEVIDNHLCLCVDYVPGTELTYYFGGGWSAFPQGEYTCDEDWFDALEHFKQQVDSPLTMTSWEGELPQRDDVIDALYKANLYWQQTHPTHGDHFWNRAVYHTGNMAAYAVTGEKQFLDYSVAWAERNRYWGQTGTDKSRWKFGYGESADYVLFGDNQVCFQTYIDLYNILGGEEKIARALEVMNYQISTDESGYLWWVDGLYMVLPILTKLYAITGNHTYLDKLYEYWRWGTDLMWDEAAGLYYRDRHYIYPDHKTSSGGKDFWARGDGWIFAAFARVLDELPADDSHRDEYNRYYRRMAESLRLCQRTDDEGNGYWCRSLLDEAYAPGYETSGTALNVFAYAWGINHGILDEAAYGQTLQRGWHYLTRVALQENGAVGYVQPIGSNAAPGTSISASQTADFGVGAFLLAAAEMSRYAAGEQATLPLRIVSAELVSPAELRITFNTLLSDEGLTDADNYRIDGLPVDATDISYDGGTTLTITLRQPLDYGCYRFTVQGIKSADGAELSSTAATHCIMRTVALSPNTLSMTVTASGAQSGNPAANIADNSYGTRWSQEGKGQWVQFDLGETACVAAVDIAFYLGNTRVNYFDIRTSVDGQTWTDVLKGMQSSGLTTEMERYRLPEAVEARYVRIVCNGASTTTWNSITEVRIRLDETTLPELSIPDVAYTDILLPTHTPSGEAIAWTTSDAAVMTAGGLATTTDEQQSVTLTAHYAGQKQEYDITVMPRSLDHTLQLRYDFETDDVYSTDSGQRMLKDHSRHGRDAQLTGDRCVIDGTLNLTANTVDGFADNGYVLVPCHLLDSLRSYTVIFTATPSSLDRLPRFYDFGSAPSNSFFLRASSFAAGLKYNGQTTTLVKAGELSANEEFRIAVSFDARTHTTTVYVNGQLAAQDNSIKYEPCQLAANGSDTRNYIGRTQWWDTTSRNDNKDFCGTIDDFRLYSLCLTPDELTETLTGMRYEKLKVKNAGWFDLSGRRITQPVQKGIYIVDGKKIVVK